MTTTNTTTPGRIRAIARAANRARSRLNVAGFATDGMSPDELLAAMDAMEATTTPGTLYRGRATDTTETDDYGLTVSGLAPDLSGWLDSIGL